jgi:hypothetical protein
MRKIRESHRELGTKPESQVEQARERNCKNSQPNRTQSNPKHITTPSQGIEKKKRKKKNSQEACPLGKLENPSILKLSD